jgi:hypothetical protein
MEKQFQQIAGVRALSLLFFNYTQDDIAQMCQENWSFQYIWEEKIDKNQDTYSQLWKHFCESDLAMQTFILNKALSKFEKEVKNGLESEIVFQRLINENTSDKTNVS